MLIEQMGQYSNKLFQEMLIKARTNLLNNSNITVLNSKVATKCLYRIHSKILL